MNIKDFKWTEKRFGTRFANILKKLGGLSKDSTDGSIEYKDDQGNVTKLVTDSNFSSLLAKNGLIEVKWQELKDKRDNGQLIPGSLYRITDYNCTTTQENTRSAGHQFDIVLLALSEDKLAEEGWAMMHENDTYFVNSNLSAWKVWYCLDNDTARFAWADNTYKLNPASIICDCYVAGNKKVDGPIDYYGKQFVNGTIYYRDEENDTTIPYMGNMPVYAWTSENNITIFTESVSPNSFSGTYTYNNRGDMSYISGDAGITYKTTSYVEGLSNYDFPNGRGVIYRLIDEWNNDVPYDFKNIQQLLPLVDEIEYDEEEGVGTWVYTLDIYDLINQIHSDASINGNRMPDIDEEMVRGVTNNLIEPSFIIGSDNPIQCLGKTAMIVSTNDEDSFMGMSSNSIKKYNGTNIPTRVLTNCISCTILENVIFAIFIGCDCCILCNGSTSNRVEQSQLIYKISNQSYKWYITQIDKLTSFATMLDLDNL